jgi:hypothetical protein
MAFKLDLTKIIRNFAACMNVAIALIMFIGLWIFLTQDGMHPNLGWLIWVPLLTFLFIGFPLWITWLLFSDSSQKQRIAFLALNVFAFWILFAGTFADRWITASIESPFSLRSVAKICFIVGTPFLVNTMALVFLLSRKRIS